MVEPRAGMRPGGGATACEWEGLRPVGVAYRNSHAALAQVRKVLSPSAPSACRGNPGDRSGNRSGSGADPSLSTIHNGPESGGGAAGSHPQGAGEREQVRGSPAGSGWIPGSRRFCPSRSCFRTGALMTSWRIRWSPMVRVELLDVGGRGD